MQRSLYIGSKSDRHRYDLVESSDLFILKLRYPRNVRELLQRVPSIANGSIDIRQIAHFPDSLAYVYRVIGNSVDRDSLKLEIREVLSSEIEYVGTIFEYSHSGVYQIYTGNIFIQFNHGLSNREQLTFLARNNLVNKQKLHFAEDVYFVEPEYEVDRNIFDHCLQVADSPQVECCHPELVTELHPFKSLQNLLPLTGTEDMWWLEAASIPEAWKSTQGYGSIIAVIDDGIEMRHPAFRGRLYRPKNMLDYKGQREPIHQGNQGHGTACASVAGSSAFKAPGVAPMARIMPIRVTGLGSVLQAEAFYWAVHNKADVISCSWGPPDGNVQQSSGSAPYFPIPDHIRLAIEYASVKGREGRGCPVVFAAGNGNEPVNLDGYASHPRVISVGAVNKLGHRAGYSDYGYPLACVFPSGDIGQSDGGLISRDGIPVADRLGMDGFSPGDFYSNFTGTSASAPGVAGVIALMLSVNPALSLRQIKDILLPASADKVGPAESYNQLGYSEQFGFGRINAGRAVRLACQTAPAKLTGPNGQITPGRWITDTSNTFSTINNIPMTTSKGYSIHIGINEVSTDYYKNHIPRLSACIQDKDRMKKLAEEYGYQAMELEDAQATRQGIKDAISQLGEQMTDGDTLLVTYAGHGVQLRDENAGSDESDGYDESWVTYDGFLLDDELYNSFALIQKEVRIVLVSDSCHSESMSRLANPYENNDPRITERFIPPSVARTILKENCQNLADLRRSAGPKPDQVICRVINFSACLADETAKETADGGVFTDNLIHLIQNDKTLSYREIAQRLAAQLASNYAQSPNITLSHSIDPNLEDEIAFLLQAKSTSGIAAEADQDQYAAPVFGSGEILIYNSNKQVAYTEIVESGNRAVGNSPWNAAYNKLFSTPVPDFDYLEPNVISNLYYDRSLNSDTNRSGGKFLSTYPNPEQYNDTQDFIWHLGTKFSQLRDAAEKVFPELMRGRREIDTNKRYVRIAHIDTGIIPDHPTTPMNLLRGKTFDLNRREWLEVKDLEKNSLAEQQGHGQGTISILAGNWVSYEETGNEFQGFFGAVPYAEILPIKISESVVLLTGRLFALAIDYAIEQQVDVISMSMAGLPSRVMAEAVNRAYEKGIVLVSAASNCWSKGAGRAAPRNILYPARYDRVIAAVGCTYTKAPYRNAFNKPEERAAGGEFMESCYGPAYAMEHALAAYSPNITWWNKKSRRADGTMDYFVRTGGGTSSATPQIAAAAALYIQYHREELEASAQGEGWRKVEIVRRALYDSADKNSKYVPEYFGQGMLKACHALDEQFKPSRIQSSVVQAAAASTKIRFTGGLLSAFFGWRGAQARELSKSGQKRQHDILAGMLHAELNQLAYLDPDLESLQELDFEHNSEFSPDLLSGYLEPIQKSPFASSWIRQFASKCLIDQGIKMDYPVDERHITNDLGTINVRSIGHRMRLARHTDRVDEQYFVTELIMIPDQIRASEAYLRTMDLEPGFEIHIQPLEVPRDQVNGSMLILEKTFVDGEILTEIQIGNTPESATGLRGLSKKVFQEHHYRIGEAAAGRGIGKVLKNLTAKVVQWVQGKNADNTEEEIRKVLEKEGENSYEMLIYDLEMTEFSQIKNEKGWVDVRHLDKALRDRIFREMASDPKPVLIGLPGLFSKVESGFKEFLGQAAIRNSLRKEHARYAIGFNVADVFHGIKRNSDTIASWFEQDYGGFFKQKACHVIARSRGGLVARHLFEINWFNQTNAPFKLLKLITTGSPHQGTLIASAENWSNLLNISANMAQWALGSTLPVIPSIARVVKGMAMGLVRLDGISDLDLGSPLTVQLNQIQADRSGYYTITSNYEPKLIGSLLDEGIIDRVIHKQMANDTITPTEGALFELQKFQSVVTLNNDQKLIVPESHACTHFAYLDPEKQRWCVEQVIRILCS